MAADRVADLTMEELETLIERIVAKRAGGYWLSRKRGRSVAEVLESMRKNIWTPPPGARSSLEMLREDRDR
jgi:hypothetical protein